MRRQRHLLLSALLFVGFSCAFQRFSVAAPPSKPTYSTAVIGAGTDPVMVGRLQHRVWSKLRTNGQRPIPISKVAAVLAVEGNVGRGAPEVNPRLKQTAETTLAGVRAIFYDKKFDEALLRLSDLERAFDEAPIGTADFRVRLLLWRAAIQLAKRYPEAAEQAVLAALVLRPSATVSTDEFPPSLVDLVAGVRKTKFKVATVNLAGVPSKRAVVYIDDQRVKNFKGLVFAVGPHTIEVRAPYHRAIRRAFDVPAQGATIRVECPIALNAEDEATLLKMASVGRLTEADNTFLKVLSRKLGVPTLVIAAVFGGDAEAVGKPQARTLIWRRGADFSEVASATVDADAAGFESLAAAVAVELEHPAAWRLSAGAGVGVAFWQPRISIYENSPVDPNALGVGPSLEMNVARDWFDARVTLSARTFQLNNVDFESPDEDDFDKITRQLGNAYDINVRAGPSYAFSPRFPGVGGFVYGRLNSYSTAGNTLREEEDPRIFWINPLASYTRVGLGVGAFARYAPELPRDPLFEVSFSADLPSSKARVDELDCDEDGENELTNEGVAFTLLREPEFLSDNENVEFSRGTFQPKHSRYFAAELRGALSLARTWRLGARYGFVSQVTAFDFSNHVDPAANPVRTVTPRLQEVTHSVDFAVQRRF